MNLFFLTNEINELEEAIEQIGRMYEEIYHYTKWTFWILISIIIAKILFLIIKVLVKWQIHLDKKEWPEEDKKILKDEIDTNQ